ncbi:MAG TPA: PDZ domain-containing protein, partial [Coleofasciculaceae cyanobacterium]
NPRLDRRVVAERGVLIVRVGRGSPADKAGLQPGDVIQSINNQQMTKAEQVQQQVEKSGVGSQLPIRVQRGDQTLEVTVQPAPLPTQPNR